MAVDASVNFDLFDGKTFKPNTEGESGVGKLDGPNTVIFPADWKSAKDVFIEPIDEKDYDSEEIFKWSNAHYERPFPVKKDRDLTEFISLNGKWLELHGIEEKARVELVTLRTVIVQKGFMDVDWLLEGSSRKLQYTDCWKYEEEVFPKFDEKEILENKEFIELVLDPENVEKMTGIAFDLIGCVACIYRARGHHYLPDTRESYQKLWKACMRVPYDGAATWEQLTTVGMHFIYPDVLDKLWAYGEQASLVSGTLRVRYDCAAAGTAAVVAAQKALSDLETSGLPVPTSIGGQILYVKSVSLVLQSHRFCGSVNKTQYKAPSLRWKPHEVGASVAAVMSFLAKRDRTNPLLQSEALKKLVSGYAITGLVFGVVMDTILERHTDNLAKRALEDSGTGIVGGGPITIPVSHQLEAPSLSSVPRKRREEKKRTPSTGGGGGGGGPPGGGGGGRGGGGRGGGAGGPTSGRRTGGGAGAPGDQDSGSDSDDSGGAGSSGLGGGGRSAGLGLQIAGTTRRARRARELKSSDGPLGGDSGATATGAAAASSSSTPATSAPGTPTGGPAAAVSLAVPPPGTVATPSPGNSLTSPAAGTTTTTTTATSAPAPKAETKAPKAEASTSTSSSSKNNKPAAKKPDTKKVDVVKFNKRADTDVSVSKEDVDANIAAYKATMMSIATAYDDVVTTMDEKFATVKEQVIAKSTTFVTKACETMATMKTFKRGVHYAIGEFIKDYKDAYNESVIDDVYKVATRNHADQLATVMNDLILTWNDDISADWVVRMVFLYYAILETGEG